MKLFKSKSPDPAPSAAKQDNATSSKGLSFFKRRREEQPNESSSYIAMEDGSKALSPGSSAKSVELSKMNPFKSSPKNMDDNASTSNRSLKSELLKASPKNDDKSIRSIKSSEKSVRSIQSVPEEEQEPLTKSTFVCLLGWCAIPCAAYILLFTVSPLKIQRNNRHSHITIFYNLPCSLYVHFSTLNVSKWATENSSTIPSPHPSEPTLPIWGEVS